MPFLQPAVAYAYDDKIEIYFNFTERKNPDDSDDNDSRDNNYVNCSDILPMCPLCQTRIMNRGPFFIRAKRPQKTVRQIKNGGTQISFCVPPFLFRYIKSVRLQLCIYCLIDSFKLVSVNRRITAEKQSPQ